MAVVIILAHIGMMMMMMMMMMILMRGVRVLTILLNERNKKLVGATTKAQGLAVGEYSRILKNICGIRNLPNCDC